MKQANFRLTKRLLSAIIAIIMIVSLLPSASASCCGALMVMCDSCRRAINEARLSVTATYNAATGIITIDLNPTHNQFSPYPSTFTISYSRTSALGVPIGGSTVIANFTTHQFFSNSPNNYFIGFEDFGVIRVEVHQVISGGRSLSATADVHWTPPPLAATRTNTVELCDCGVEQVWRNTTLTAAGEKSTFESRASKRGLCECHLTLTTT